MDLYTDPAPRTYATWALFNMPTKDGGSIRSIALPLHTCNLIMTGYSILLWLLFCVAWQLVLYIVIAFFPSVGSPNRHVLLVGFWNSRDPLTAFVFMLNYTWTAFSNIKTETGRRDWRTFGWSCLLLLVAICGMFGGITTGIVLPAAMAVGNVAPAQPSEVFFADPPTQETTGERLRIQAMRAPAAIRAIGSVEASGVTQRPRVMLSDRVTGKDGSGNPISEYTYDYKVNGWDLGLQDYSGFQQIVQGKCTTEYPRPESGTASVDKYFPWGNESEDEIVSVWKTAEEHDPPHAEIRVHPGSKRNATSSSQIYFTIIPHTVGRHSFTGSSDPWYSTTLVTNALRDSAGYKVEVGRPALSCSQKTSYVFKESRVENVFHLKNLTGFDIPEAWSDHFSREFGLPKIVDLGQSLGRGALLSSATYLNGNFDARSSTIKRDIERLVLGAFVASRDIFRDSTMVTQTDWIKNAARRNDSTPYHDVGKFVLATGEVVTVQYSTLVTIPVVFTFLSSIVIVTSCLSKKFGGVSNEGCRARFSTRRTALQATQLYRYMDEHVAAEGGISIDEPAGKYYSSSNKRWKGRIARIPYVQKQEANGATKDVGPFKVSNSLKPKVVPATPRDIQTMTPGPSTGTGSPRVELALTRAWLPGIDHNIRWKEMNELVRDDANPRSRANYAQNSGAGIDYTQDATVGADRSQNAGTRADRTPPLLPQPPPEELREG